MGGGVSLGATAVAGTVLWLGLSMLLREGGGEVLILGLVAWMSAMPIAFCLGAAATLYAHLSPRWQPDPLPGPLLTYAVPPASLVVAAAWATFGA